MSSLKEIESKENVSKIENEVPKFICIIIQVEDLFFCA